MRKIVRVLLVFILVIITGVAAMAVYVKKALPNVGAAPELQIERTQERIERGRYLANNVIACMDCHSQRDWTVFAAPIKEGTFGAGGEKFGKEMQFPGTLYSANITPHGLANWSDGEIFRAITTGQTKTGKAIFPLMGYQSYGKMDQEDLFSIIAYLRTLPSIKNDVPERELDFPVNFIVNSIPEKASLSAMPAKTNKVAYGRYLVTIANCQDCHSKVDKKGNLIEGTEFGGGRVFNFPNGTIVTTPNISADEESGIGYWTKEAFIQKFKQYSDSSYQPQKLGGDDFNTPMPWFMYTGMDTSDLSAIYTYLRTVKKIHNPVNKFSRQ